MAKSAPNSPLEDGLLVAMQAIDKQISREMQRTPREREEKGVQKWEPFQTRIERIAALVIDSLGDDSITIDPVLVLSQAYTKCLQLIISDLERDGLGEVRASYCITAMENISLDADKALRMLRGSTDLV